MSEAAWSRARWRSRNPLALEPGEIVSREKTSQRMIDVTLWRCKKSLGAVRVNLHAMKIQTHSWSDDVTCSLETDFMEQQFDATDVRIKP